MEVIEVINTPREGLGSVNSVGSYGKLDDQCVCVIVKLELVVLDLRVHAKIGIHPQFKIEKNYQQHEKKKKYRKSRDP